MKRIALLTDSWHRMVEYVTVKGILDSFSDYEDDVVICQFNCFGNWSKDEKHNRGEYNIYMLPDLSQFDGAVLHTNTIVDMAQLENLIRQSKSADIPVVTIGFEVDGFYYVGVDNKESIFDLMNHLYNNHGCRSFVFAGGPPANSENSLRMQAYKDFLNLYELNPKENPVLIGDFDFMTGCRHFNTMLDKHIPIPDAFVCANDNIAAGLISEALKNGYSVPDDFLVTGFDNLDKAAFYTPQISTVGYKRERVGELCADIFKSVWRDDGELPDNFAEHEYYYTESCGCESLSDIDYRMYACNNIKFGVQMEVNESRLLEFESRMMACTEFDGIFAKVGEFFSNMECEEVYFFIDERLYTADSQAKLPKEGYDWSHLKMVYAMKDRIKTRFKNITEVINYLEQEGCNTHYLFTPIHFGDHTVGFSVIKNAEFLEESSYFYEVHSTIVKSLNTLYVKKQLENANKNLNELYIKDSMTGAYNRIAFAEKIIPCLKQYHKQGISCAISFTDTDNFKKINDEFGHGYGDRVLKIIALNLIKLCPEEGIVCRYGGDEFVIFYPIKEGVSTEKYRENVIKSLRRDDINISMGTVVTNPLSAKDFDEYIQEADQRMYKEKQSKRTDR